MNISKNLKNIDSPILHYFSGTTYFDKCLNTKNNNKHHKISINRNTKTIPMWKITSILFENTYFYWSCVHTIIKI